MIGWELAERVAARPRRRGRRRHRPARGPRGAGGRGRAGGRRLHAARARERRCRRAEAVGRDEWSRANVRLLRATIAPLEERDGRRPAAAPGPLRAVAGGVLGAQIGGLVGYMSRRVLGQYEVALAAELPAAPRLLLVAPNLRELAATIDAPLADLLAWVTVHELTHAVQFSAVAMAAPASRRAARRAARAPPRSASTPARCGSRRSTTPARCWDRARDGGLVGAVAGPERTELLERVQCDDGASSRATPSTSWTPPARRSSRTLGRLREALERAAPSARRSPRCSSGCSASSSSCASTATASASATTSSSAPGSRGSTARSPIRCCCRRPRSWPPRATGSPARAPRELPAAS